MQIQYNYLMLRLTVNYSANSSIINVRKNCSCNARCCSCSTSYHDIPSNCSSPSWISIALKLNFFFQLEDQEDLEMYIATVKLQLKAALELKPNLSLYKLQSMESATSNSDFKIINQYQGCPLLKQFHPIWLGDEYFKQCFMSISKM